MSLEPNIIKQRRRITIDIDPVPTIVLTTITYTTDPNNLGMYLQWFNS